MNGKSYTGSISLVRVKDGLNGGSYFISTNYNEILQVIREEGISFSPEDLSFQIQDLNNQDSGFLSDFQWRVSFLYTEGFKEIATNDSASEEGFKEIFSWSFLEAAEHYGSEKNNNPKTTLHFFPLAFYNWLKNQLNYKIVQISSQSFKNGEHYIYEDGEYISPTSYIENKTYYIKEIDGNQEAFLNQGRGTIKFDYLKDDMIFASKVISFQVGTSANMAHLAIGINDIVASVNKSSLRFSAEGLSLNNGDFVIKKPKYTLLGNISKDDYDRKNEYLYYIDNNNSTYQKAQEYVSSQIYYFYEEDPVLYTQNDDLTIKGAIYANSGEFHGDVYAENGYFRGEIQAQSGAIGGFEINSYKAISEFDTQRNCYVCKNKKFYLLLFEENKFFYFDDFNEKQIIEDIFKESLYIYSPHLQSANGAVILDGSNGLISADSIELGSQATIADKIVFSKITNNGTEEVQAALYNPTLHEQMVLRAGQTRLYADGKLKLGTLELFGGTGNLDGYLCNTYTDTSNQLQTGEWFIGENGTAKFDRVSINNLSLKHSVLEIDTVQGVGSTMVFTDAWEPYQIQMSDNTTVISLNESTSLAKEDWIRCGKSCYKIGEITTKVYYYKTKEQEFRVFNKKEFDPNETYYERINANIYSTEKKLLVTAKVSETSSYALEETSIYYETEDLVPIRTIITLNSELPEDLESYIIMKFGRSNITSGSNTTEQIEYDYILSACGTLINNPSPQDFQSSQSISISSFKETNGILQFTKHLVLGNLSKAGIYDVANLGGFGLYSDNVYLNGALVTRIETSEKSIYAGINTNSSVTMNCTENSAMPNTFADSSQIVFWAGAEGFTNDAVQNAKFQVSKNGTVYAQQAIIEGSMLVKNQLYGGSFYGAKFFGTDATFSKEAPISVYGSNSVNGIKCYLVQKNAESKGTEYFSLSTDGLSYNTTKKFVSFDSSNNVYVTSFKDSYNTSLAGNQLEFYNTAIKKASIYYDDTDPILKIEVGENVCATFQQDEVTIEKPLVAQSSFWLSGTMEYNPAFKNNKIVGYDLYVH